MCQSESCPDETLHLSGQYHLETSQPIYNDRRCKEQNFPPADLNLYPGNSSFLGYLDIHCALLKQKSKLGIKMSKKQAKHSDSSG